MADNSQTTKPKGKKWPKAYLDKERPGIVRFEGGDSMDGLLAGTRAAEIVKRWNSYDEK